MKTSGYSRCPEQGCPRKIAETISSRAVAMASRSATGAQPSRQGVSGGGFDGGEKTKAKEGKNEVLQLAGPWRRYLARSFDWSWEPLVIFFIAIYFFSGAVGDQGQNLIFFWLFAWIGSFALDAVLHGTLGNTPGKWLLGIVVQKNGRRPEFSDLLRRNFYILVHGVWFGLPLLAVFPLNRCYKRVKAIAFYITHPAFPA